MFRKCAFVVSVALVGLMVPVLSFGMFSGGSESAHKSPSDSKWIPNESGLYREVTLPTQAATYFFKFKGKPLLQLTVQGNEIITQSNGLRQTTWIGGSSMCMRAALVYEMTSQDNVIKLKFEVMGKTTDIDEIQEN